MSDSEHDAWLFKLDKLRGDTRGLLRDKLQVKLKSALDALRDKDPYIDHATEQIDDCLMLISRALETLQKE